jgi:hypothetical protein
MVHLECRNEIVPQIQLKYNQKLDIKEEKAKDIYSMRGYCNILTENKLNYWYLLPNKDQHENMTEKEQIDMQILWLENKVFTNNMEEEWLTDMTEQSQMLCI